MRKFSGPLAAIVALAALVALLVYLFRTPDDVPVGLEPRPPARARPVAGGAPGPGQILEPQPSAAAAPESGAPDPRLAQLRVELEPASREPAPPEAQPGPTHAMVSRIVEGLKPEGKDGRGFGFQGEMAVTYPGPVSSPDKARASFGAGDEVTSRFKRVQDERGNFCQHEESHSKTGKTKYDGPAYNGDWGYVDGQYGHVDGSGHRASESEMSAILQERQGPRFEPLVMRTLRELLVENEPLIGFEPAAGSAGDAQGERYGIAPLPPEQRGSPTQVKRLGGDVRFVSQGGALLATSFSGELLLGSGYMKGAPLTFTVRVEAIPPDQLPPVKLP